MHSYVQILERVIAIFRQAFQDDDRGMKFLHDHGITDPNIPERYGIGLCTGSLQDILPGSGPIIDDLKSLGILDSDGREQHQGAITFPWANVNGMTQGLVYLHPKTGCNTLILAQDVGAALWNIEACRRTPDVIITGSVLDALSLNQAGYENVMAVVDPKGITAEEIEELEAAGVRSINLVGCGDQKKRLVDHFFVFDVEPPADHTPTSYLISHGADALAEIIKGSEKDSKDESSNIESTSDGFTVTYGTRQYLVRGLERSKRSLKATIRIDVGGRFHVDTIDLYAARKRRQLCQDICRTFEQPADTIQNDMNLLFIACEEQSQKGNHQVAPDVSINESDRLEAVKLGQDPHLIDRIIADYEVIGIIGESSNKLISPRSAVRWTNHYQF